MRAARSSIVGFSNMIFCEMRETALRVLESGDVRKALASLFRKYVTLKLRNVLKTKTYAPVLEAYLSKP